MDRRSVIAAGASLAAASIIPARGATLTVADILDRMHGQIGTGWREGGVDRIIVGDAATQARGIATTMMATFDALKGAVAAGCNLVITHEPTWWSHQDALAGLENDPLYKAKLAYIREHNLVSFRFHDHWHARQPIDGINFGMAAQMGWTPYRDPANQRHYNLPPTTLAALAKTFRTKLNDRTLRVVGDPHLSVSKVVTSWGYYGMPIGAASVEEGDVLVIGEAQDWDLIAYVQDAAASGRKKGLIVLGHILSEQWGMKFCAEWLKGFVSEVPVRWVQLPEPYWNLPR